MTPSVNRRFFFQTTLAGMGGLLARPLWADRMSGRVQGDAGRVLAHLDRRIYGQNLEFTGRIMEGGILAEPGSQSPQSGPGIRADVRDALRELGVTHCRWPGGCFADAYHWRDGIGEERSRQKNSMWDRPLFKGAAYAMGEFKATWGTAVNHRFGTGEFLEYCRQIGAEPSLTASMEPDAPDQAAAWVAYVREKFGPRAVPVWAVGNEQWNLLEHNGCSGHPARYVERYLRWAEAMRRENPLIHLVASGHDELIRPEWNRVLLEGIGRKMDYLSYHIYLPGPSLKHDIPHDEAAYLALAACYLQVEESLHRGAEAMARILGEPIPIALDEWNVNPSARSFIAPYISLREAIAAAGIIHALHRQAGLVKIADQFAAVNSTAPAIITDRDRLARTPMFHLLRLYSRRSLAQTAKVEVASPAFSTRPLGRLPARDHAPFLDASLTVAEGRATLFLINRHPHDPLEVEIAIEGIKPGAAAVLETVAGPSFQSENRIGEPETVRAVSRDLTWPERITLPPCSVSALATV